ncbi:MAG: hypothetical protein WB800_10175 [Streptosporangiaceae bacterium]
MKDRQALLNIKPWTLGWWMSWPDPLRLDLRNGAWRQQKQILLAFAVIIVGVAVALIPASYDERALGGLTGSGPDVNVPALCFLVGDLCLAMGVWAAAKAAQGKPFQRLFIAVLGIASAALAGQSSRRVLQIVLLRDFYRPSLFFTGTSRAAAIGWGALLAAAVVLGVLAPVALALANLLPRVLARAIRPASWLGARHSWLLIPFAALALTMIVTQWVLPPTLATAMGYQYPAESGGYLTVSLHALSPVPWYSLQLLVGLPLVVGMWEGVEAARFSHRLVKRPDGSDTRLFARVKRLGYLPPAILVLSAALALAIIERQVVALVAGIAVMLVTGLALGGVLGPLARMSKSFDRRVARWALPEEWRDIGPISLVLAILVLPVAGLLASDIYRGAEEAFRLPWDVENFFFYWQDYGITRIPSFTASEIFGHVESELWRASFAGAVLLLFGLIFVNKRERAGVRRGIWFLCRVGLLALALAPIARLADHSFATALLGACAVTPFLLADRGRRPAAVWSVVLTAAALSVWSLVLWRIAWIPAAAVLGLTILLRFAVNAGDLNKTKDKRRANRIAYFQSLALLSAGMLVLGHGAAPGFFYSDALSTVTDHISLSIVAVVWVVLLVHKQLEAGRDDPDRNGASRFLEPKADGEAGLPASWSWMLDPELELVAFLGRKQELEDLTAWASRRDAARLRLITGQGGSGKTRLAIELCARVRKLGWIPVWVPPGREEGLVPTLRFAAVDQALIIVDDAESRDGLVSLIRTLAAPGGAGLRVLVIARSTGEWWRRLRRASPAALDLVDRAMRDGLALSPTVRGDATDAQIVRHAATSIARQLRLPEPQLNTSPRTSQRQSILQLLAVALAGTMRDAALAETGAGTVQVNLLKRLDPLLEHEQEFWQDRARDAGLLGARGSGDPVVLRQVIAASCLLGAGSVEAAAAVAARVAGLSRSPELTQWLAGVCSASRSWTTPDGILHPGQLAELLALRQLTDDSGGFVGKCLADLAASQALHAVSFLARATADYKEAAGLLGTLLQNLDERITGAHVPAQALIAAFSVVPDRGGALAAAAVTLNRKIVSLIPPGRDQTRSYWLEELSCRLGTVGQHDDAVRAAEDAVALRQELAADSAELHGSAMVLSLENLAERLQQQPDKARRRSVLAKAVRHCRDLAFTDPALYRPWLARLLTSAAACYDESSDPASSAAEAGEAAALYRQAVLERPGLYEGKLGQCLEILSLRCLDDERPAESVSAGAEAVAIYQNLLASSCGQYRLNLARTLDNLSISLRKARRRAEALDAARQAAANYGKLQRSNPGQFTPGYAHALGSLSACYRSLGQNARAVAPARQRVGLCRTLVKQNPNRYRELLADSLISLSAVLEQTGNKPEAAAVRQEAAKLHDLEHA